MQSAGLDRVKAIFAEAMERTAVERQAFLDHACGGDAQLRAEVEAFLSAAQRAGAFLSNPTSGPAAPTEDPLSGVLREGPGTEIGAYKLLQLIGEGGFGSVFMAEQEHPVRRKVALKIIKLGMDTRQVIARFEAERQALAMMDHPNIATVLDAGATESGRPYFVMELVRGIPIIEFCDGEKLTTRQRVELFIHVCQAIQHAHQKGVIHRDIKSGNVLVTMHDDKPVPKVIDFGIAKATSARLTEKTLFTEYRQFIGTPAYMSPEQAQLSGLDVDTRSDIYSLGVLLYELLTGSTPFDSKALYAAAYDEIRRIIREVEPPKPSTRISGLGATLQNIAQQRRIEPAKFANCMRGELDWIVMKCLEKDRTRRYETANGLARDIQRYLTDEPVEASPPSSTYRLHKFARKHRAALRMVAGFASLLIGATIFSSWQAVRATRASGREAAQRQRAEAAAQRERQAKQNESDQRKEAEAVAGILESVFRGLDPHAEQKRGTVVNQQLAARLDRVAASLEQQHLDPPIRQSRLRNAIGETLLDLGETSKAEALFRAALAEQRTQTAPDDPAILITLNNLARVYLDDGRYTDAIKLFEQVRDRRLERLGPDQADTLTTLHELAWAHYQAGHYAEMIKLLEHVRDRRTQTLGADDIDTLSTLRDLADGYRHVGRYDDSIKLLEQVRERRVAKLGPNHPDTLATMNDLALAFESVGRTKEAINLLERVRLVRVQELGPGHPDTLEAVSNLALAYASAGRGRDAGKLMEQVRYAAKLLEPKREQLTHGLEKTTAALTTRPADPSLLVDRATFYARLGRFRDSADDFTKAGPGDLYRWHQNLPLLLQLGDMSGYRRGRSEALRRFRDSTGGVAHTIAKDALMAPIEGEELRMAVELADRGVATDPQAWSFQTKGMAEYRRANYREAIPWFVKSRADHSTRIASTMRDATAEFFLGMAHQKLGDGPQARTHLARGIIICENELPRAGEADLGKNFMDWILCQLARREAEELINGQGPTTRLSVGN